MSILVGIKRQHASGSSHTEEGFGGFSITTNSLEIIKEGKKSDLEEYVNHERSGFANARKNLDTLYSNLEFSGMSEKEFEKLEDTYRKQLYLSRFDTLMILEGEIMLEF